MCEKCNGIGRKYTEVMNGVWEITPCSCVEPVERDWAAFLERWEKKVAEHRNKKRRNQRENEHCSDGKVLLTT